MRVFPSSAIAVGSVTWLVGMAWCCLALPPSRPATALGLQQTPPDSAAIEVRAVALVLGPTDQVEGERRIQGLAVSLSPRSSATAAVPGTGAPDRGSPLPREAAAELTGPAGRTDSAGTLVLTVPPGSYRVCADAESIASPPSRVSLCETVTLTAGRTEHLLIRHTPLGDFLAFHWQDHEPSPGRR